MSMTDYSSTGEHQNIKPKNYVRERILSNSKSFFGRLLLRKPMGLLQVEIDTLNELRRSVTPIQMIALAIGGIIG